MVRGMTAALSGLAMVIGLAPAAASAEPDPVEPAWTYVEDFSEGFAGWEPDTDGLARDWSLTHVPAEEYPCWQGAGCLRYWIDGSNDAGIIWVVKRFDVEPGGRQVDMSFWVENPNRSEVNTWAVGAYVGVERPVGFPGQFTYVGHPHETVGWKQYLHSQELHTEGEVWVAISIAVDWEITREYLVDLVEIDFDAHEGG